MEPDAYPKILLLTAISSVFGLILGCILVGVVASPILVGLEGETNTISQVLAASVAGLVISFFAMMFGVFPALLYVAPLQAWLRQVGYANVLTAALLGAVPGALWLPYSREWGIAILTYGVAVSVCTHLVASIWMRRRAATTP